MLSHLFFLIKISRSETFMLVRKMVDRTLNFHPTSFFKSMLLQLFTIAKTWKEPNCSSTDEWIKKMWYIYIMEYYSAIKKSEIMPFVTICMQLEIMILSEVSQKEKDKYHMISLICEI